MYRLNAAVGLVVGSLLSGCGGGSDSTTPANQNSGDRFSFSGANCTESIDQSDLPASVILEQFDSCDGVPASMATTVEAVGVVSGSMSYVNRQFVATSMIVGDDGEIYLHDGEVRTLDRYFQLSANTEKFGRSFDWGIFNASFAVLLEFSASQQSEVLQPMTYTLDTSDGDGVTPDFFFASMLFDANDDGVIDGQSY